MASFLSYAQNFEDVMLWRALRDVKQGFYVDVGAADPDEYSVTRAFYDRGWSGINIEPSPDYFSALRDARPRDINLACAVGDCRGTVDFYDVSETGLSTTDRDIAMRHAGQGLRVTPISVPARTLADVFQECASADIHFLKVDVEGSETAVLRGADFQAFRPWIVLLEATEPLSRVENWQNWEPLLHQAGYVFVWFDGLNRFYVAAERAASLAHAFQTPPNIFDAWVRPRGPQQLAIIGEARAVEDAARTEAQAIANAARVETQAIRLEAAALRDEITALRARLIEADRAANAERMILQAEVNRLAGADWKCAQTEAMIAALLSSTSWTITSPLRSLSTTLRQFRIDRLWTQHARIAGGIAENQDKPNRDALMASIEAG